MLTAKYRIYILAKGLDIFFLFATDSVRNRFGTICPLLPQNRTPQSGENKQNLPRCTSGGKSNQWKNPKIMENNKRKKNSYPVTIFFLISSKDTMRQVWREWVLKWGKRSVITMNLHLKTMTTALSMASIIIAAPWRGIGQKDIILYTYLYVWMQRS